MAVTLMLPNGLIFCNVVCLVGTTAAMWWSCEFSSGFGTHFGLYNAFLCMVLLPATLVWVVVRLHPLGGDS